MRYKYCYRCGKRYLAGTKCCSNNVKKANDDKKKVYNSSIWRCLRNSKLQEQPYCIRCYTKFSYLQTGNLELHHILSLEHYPEYKFESGNLVIICRTCNLELGDSSKVDFELPKKNREWLEEIGYM